MANERVLMARNTAAEGEAAVWEPYFPKSVVDAILASDKAGETKTVVDLINERIQSVVGSAPENFDTLQEIAAYIESHQEVADALQAAVGNKANKDEIVYKNQTASTVAVGGIPAGYVPPAAGINATELLDKMLHAYVAPKVTAAAKPTNGGVFEVSTSQSVTAVDVTITFGSTTIKKIEIRDGSTVIGSLTSGIKAGVNTVTLATALTVTANKQLTAVVTDGEDKTVSAGTGSFTFVSPYYWGAIAAGAAVTAALIKAATKVVQAKGSKSFNYTCNNQRMLIAYPKSYGALSKILDANSFDVTGTFTQSTVAVDGVDYYAYATSDPTTVSAFKMTFNY
ncbi:MAG: hypothetical protein Q4C60_07470 [Eubacteriales bacterium]|nr:hypothetical protein [Eubacteriales bacterium]